MSQFPTPPVVLKTSGRTDGTGRSSPVASAVRDDARLCGRIAVLYKQSIIGANLDSTFDMVFNSIDRLPHGYSSFQTRDPNNPRKGYHTRIYGHPSGKAFMADCHFLDHWVWLERRIAQENCLCCLCTGNPRKPYEGSQARGVLLRGQRSASVPQSLGPLVLEGEAVAAGLEYATRLVRDRSHNIVAGTKGPRLRPSLPKPPPGSPGNGMTSIVPFGSVAPSLHERHEGYPTVAYRQKYSGHAAEEMALREFLLRYGEKSLESEHFRDPGSTRPADHEYDHLYVSTKDRPYVVESTELINEESVKSVLPTNHTLQNELPRPVDQHVHFDTEAATERGAGRLATSEVLQHQSEAVTDHQAQESPSKSHAPSLTASTGSSAEDLINIAKNAESRSKEEALKAGPLGDGQSGGFVSQDDSAAQLDSDLERLIQGFEEADEVDTDFDFGSFEAGDHSFWSTE